MARPKQKPLTAVKNSPRVKKEATPKPVLSAALKHAIRTVDHMQLRMWVQHYCETIEPLRKGLESQMLVPGKEVVRYHADSDSEDAGNSDNEGNVDEDDSDADEDGSVSEEDGHSKKLKPIGITADEMVARYASCLNCNISNFDVTDNVRGECRWHTGEKEADYDDDFWADHDERCHGTITDLVDEPDYADGFKWSCCETLGDDEGCKWTKHKAEVNQIRNPPPVVVSPLAAGSRKRKARA